MPDDINPYFVLQLMTPQQQRALAEKLQAIELNATRAAEKSARLN